MKELLSWLTMKRGPMFFTDMISREPVYIYFDYYGKQWMATSPHWFFRVERIVS